MLILPSGKSHRIRAWELQVMQLEFRGSHLTGKVANKCLNVHERVEVGERDKGGPLSSPAVP